MAAAHHDPYARVAPYYDRLIEPLNRRLKAIALREAPPTPGERVLDVGCGTGTMLELYRRRGCTVSGVDASPAMLTVARRRLGHDAVLERAEATELPFEGRRFDWVVFTMVLHEMPPGARRRALAEAARVVAAGGRLLIVDYGAAPGRSLRGALLRAFVTVVERAAGREHFAGFRHYTTHGAARALAVRCGLEVRAERLVGEGNLAITVLGRPGGGGAAAAAGSAGRAAATAV